MKPINHRPRLKARKGANAPSPSLSRPARANMLAQSDGSVDAGRPAETVVAPIETDSMVTRQILAWGINE
jgi:hypothetical protein